MKTIFTSQELYVANMIFSKYNKEVKDQKKKECKALIEEQIKIHKEITSEDRVEIMSSLEHLSSTKDGSVLFLYEKNNPYFKYNFLKSDNLFVPFKSSKNSKIVDQLKFIEHFGKDRIIEAGKYTLNTKEDLIKLYDLDKKTATYEAILNQLPSSIKDIAEVKESEFYRIIPRKISWADAEDIARKNPLLSEIYMKMREALDNGINYEEMLNTGKKLESYINTAKLYLYEKDSESFDNTLFAVGKKEELIINEEALKEIAQHDSSTKVSECIKFSYGIDEEMKSIIPLLDEETLGVHSEDMYSVMSTAIKSQEDITTFLLECPENFWDNKNETTSYSDYLKNATRIKI